MLVFEIISLLCTKNVKLIKFWVQPWVEIFCFLSTAWLFPVVCRWSLPINLWWNRRWIQTLPSRNCQSLRQSPSSWSCWRPSPRFEPPARCHWYQRRSRAERWSNQSRLELCRRAESEKIFMRNVSSSFRSSRTSSSIAAFPFALNLNVSFPLPKPFLLLVLLPPRGAIVWNPLFIGSTKRIVNVVPE